MLMDERMNWQHGAVEAALHKALPVSRLEGAARLNAAVEYAVFPGGRRMRPAMTLLAAEVCGGEPKAALDVACAVEFLHAASLVFDDLPCMDDAALRRGRAALHVAFGADLATLAGLALLNQSYLLFAMESPRLVRLAARAIGVDGMIGGQSVDLEGLRIRSGLEKTTALTRLAMTAGAITAHARPPAVKLLCGFGDALGEAYQILDDVADALGSEALLGKTAGQDARHGRASAVVQWGADRARERAEGLVERSCAKLRGHFGLSEPVRLLEAFARMVVAPRAMAA
jgi:geranylgeranyl pyrophosphate synthase